MARITGLDVGTPDILGDSTDIMERRTRERPEKPMQVAQVPPDVSREIERRGPAAPAGGARPTPTDPGEIVREQARIKREREELEASAKKAGQAAVGKRYQQIRAEYEPKLSAPAPQFEAPKESFAQLGALGAMMMIMGTMGGGKGLTSATGAMNAMAGMLQGYQQGRKEVFDRAKAEFEQNYKVWQENKKNIKEAFDRAIKFAPYDIQSATNKAVAELNSKGATTLAAAVKTQGLQPTANMYADASDKADKQIETINDSIRRMAGVREPQQEVGVALAGEIPQGTRLTQQAPAKPETAADRLKRLKRQESELDTELEVLKARKTYAPPRGAEDPQWVTVEGFNNNQPFRATREERDKIANAGLGLKYVESPNVAARKTTVSDEALQSSAENIANYSNAPPGRNNRNRDEIMRRVKEINPNYRETDYGDRSLAYRNWTQPNGFGAKQLAAFNTVAQHLDTLDALGKALENGDVPAANAIVNRVRTAFGDPRVTNFDTAKLAVSGELVKAVTGAAGALKDREEAAARLLASASPAQMSGAIETWKDLIAGRLETALYQFKTGTGRTDQDFLAILPPRVREKVIDYIGVTERGGGGGRTGEITTMDQLQKAIADGSVTREEAETIFNRLRGQ